MRHLISLTKNILKCKKKPHFLQISESWNHANIYGFLLVSFIKETLIKLRGLKKSHENGKNVVMNYYIFMKLSKRCTVLKSMLKRSSSRL